MVELANWISALQAEGHVLAGVRVASPWSDYLIAQGVFAASDVLPPAPGEESRAVVVTTAGERFDAVLCVD